MNILIACELSGKVREAFRAKGHNAISCDILPSDDDSPYHYTGDVFELLAERRPSKRWQDTHADDHRGASSFDMMIAFPPCTHLCASGARWWSSKVQAQSDALDFVQRLMDANIGKIALENPVGKIGSAIRPADQYIQPWQHGHGDTKKTGLWLKGLPKLTPTNIVSGRSNRIHAMPDTKNRAKIRSETYQGIADAMAAQWG